MSDDGLPGALHGLRVVELASELGAFTGKLLADLGAEVILVEPPGGHRTRGYEPFAGDEPDPEGSLWFWNYNTSKLGVQLDLTSDAARFRALVATADVVLEAEPPGGLAALGLDHEDLRATQPSLIWVSVTPYGRRGPGHDHQATDLTLMAGAGPLWSCGYDDHTIPPVRAGGNQGLHTAALWAAMATLTAVLYREVSGEGQHVDVNAHAASNVTTEAATYEWLVAAKTVQRQTNRHAAVQRTMNNYAVGKDGRDINTGFPPRRAEDFRAVLAWLDELGLRDGFDEAFFLEMGTERDELRLEQIGADPEVTAIFGAGREALNYIASNLSSYDYFIGAQQRGLACGVVYAPEEVIADPHFVARGFPVPVHHELLGRDVVYPGAPFLMPRSPWRIARRAPMVGEHDELVLGDL